MSDGLALRQFARAAEDHAWALAQRDRAAACHRADVARWDAMVADAAARRAKARHRLMKKLIEQDPSARFALI